MDQPVPRPRRLGIADIAAVYGTEALHRRIAQLRASGQDYAAVAIEHEIRRAHENHRAPENRSGAAQGGTAG